MPPVAGEHVLLRCAVCWPQKLLDTVPLCTHHQHVLMGQVSTCTLPHLASHAAAGRCLAAHCNLRPCWYMHECCACCQLGVATRTSVAARVEMALAIL
jgi:hypothetical protein